MLIGIEPAQNPGSLPGGVMSYDLDGLAWYQARRAYAYEIGERAALQRAISAEAYLFLYKELVRLCKERTYCWAGVSWMTERLGVSEGTIKRWLRQLVDAGLIERTPRPGGDTALTRIPALVAFDASQREQPPAESSVAAGSVASPPKTPTTAPTQPLFFAPAKGIRNESRNDSDLIRHTVKRQKIKPSVVECSHQARQDVAPMIIGNPVTEALQAAGLTDPVVINELHQEPLNEIQSIIRYVASQRHIANPPGLIVALARNKAGAALSRSSRLHMKGVCNVPVALPCPMEGASHTPAVDPQLEDQIRTYLQKKIAPDVWNVWFADLRILDITETCVVVGSPNCLIRDYVQTQYLTTLIDAGTAVLGRRIMVELTIDSPS